VRQGSKIESARFAHHLNDLVVMFVFAVMGLRVRDIGDNSHQGAQVFIHLANAFIQLVNFIAHQPHCIDFRLAFGGVLHLSDLTGNGVPFCFAFLHPSNQCAAFHIQCLDGIYNTGIHLAVLQGLADQIRLFA